MQLGSGLCAWTDVLSMRASAPQLCPGLALDAGVAGTRALVSKRCPLLSEQRSGAAAFNEREKICFLISFFSASEIFPFCRNEGGG